MAQLKSFISLLLVIVLGSPLVHGDTKGTKSDGLDSLFTELGFSPSCVSQTLSLCENSSTECSHLEIGRQLNSISELVKKNAVQESSIEEMKGQFKALQEHLIFFHEQLKTFQEKIDVMFECQIHPQKARNCVDVQSFYDNESGVRTVYPFGCRDNRSVSVLCDQTTDGGGWTLIQYRDVLPQRTDFFRDWKDYQRGFGNLTQEFWLGLDNIHALVSYTPMELRVDLEDFQGQKRWAKYDHFFIQDAIGRYKLHLGKYSGDAGDSLSYHNGMQFSTKDKDNDLDEDTSCSQVFHSAWWYHTCYKANLNGFGYNESDAPNHDGIHWNGFRGPKYSLKLSSMMVRPKSRN